MRAMGTGCSSGMDRFSRARPSWVVAMALVCLLLDWAAPAVGLATNGLNLIGSGGISSDLAGADTAVATDFSAMNTNPAGMTQIKGQHAGISLYWLQPQLRLKTGTTPSTNRDGQNDPLIIPDAGYIRHIQGTPVTVGFGFFTVGGTASDFRDIKTTLGTTDKTSSQIRHYKLTPSIAYQVTDRLSVGVALAISYSDVSLAVLPNSPTGFETTGKCDRANGLAPPGSCAFAFAFVPKFGLMYHANDMVTFGLAYTMKAELPYGRGQITKNQVGIGKVTYDANVNGFKWPDDLSAGIAIRPNKDLLLSFKFQWINWDAALNNVVMNLSNGNNPTMPTDRIILQYQWRDQYVTAVGTSYNVTDLLNVHAGYNFGNNPVPKNTLDPTSANIVVHHFAGGGGYKLTNSLWLDANFTYALTNNVTYNSSSYGNNTTLSVGGYEALLTLSYWPE